MLPIGVEGGGIPETAPRWDGGALRRVPVGHEKPAPRWPSSHRGSIPSVRRSDRAKTTVGDVIPVDLDGNVRREEVIPRGAPDLSWPTTTPTDHGVSPERPPQPFRWPAGSTTPSYCPSFRNAQKTKAGGSKKPLAGRGMMTLRHLSPRRSPPPDLRGQCPAICPPSTWRISPVMKGDDSRNRMASTMSPT